MEENNISPKHKKKLVRWLILGAVVAIMFVPYPYRPGGSFRLIPIQLVEVGTQIDGEIKQIFVKEGDWVKEGQIIASIDTREHQKNVDIVLADLDKAKAELQLIEAGSKPEAIEEAKQQVASKQKRYDYSIREASRFEELFESEVISENEYLFASKTADMDANELEVAKSHLELVKSGARTEEIEVQKAVILNLNKRLLYYQENLLLTKLVSPITGQIATPYIENKVGIVLEESDPFCVIQDSRTILAEIQLPESEISEVKIGAKVSLKPSAYYIRYFNGKIVSIAPRVNEANLGKMVRVLSEVPNPDLELKPDMTGEAKIEGEWKPVIVAFTRPIVRFFTVEVWSWFP
jgi:Multidrug resistance efflux pump